MKDKQHVSSGAPRFNTRKLSDRLLASALAMAIIIAALKHASHPFSLAMGAAIGATMLTTAFTATRSPDPNASLLRRGAYLLTFGLIDAAAALDEFARAPRL